MQSEEVLQTTPAAPETEENTAPVADTLLETEDLKKIIETLLFITDRPIKPTRIADVVEAADARRVREIIQELQAEYVRDGRAVQIVEIGGGFQMATKPEYGRWVRRLYNEKMTTKLSNAALETLAIIAYKQPVTKADIERIRGVKSDHAVNRLIEYNLVYEAGRMDAPGRPALFATTEEFLRRFGVSSTVELPEMNLEQREEIKSEVEEELNLKLNSDGTPISDEELAAKGDNVTDKSEQIRYTTEDKEIEII